MSKSAHDEELDEAFARVYRATPEDFVAVRKAVVAELREKGQKEAATAIGEAKKPTSTAWAVNQLALSHRAAFENFIDAVEALRKAQRHLLEASSAKSADAKKDFADARATLNRKIAELQKLAKAELERVDVKWTLAAQRRITTTLNTAPLASPENLDRVANGRLEKDLDAAEDDSVLAVALGPLDEKKLAARTTHHKDNARKDDEARAAHARKEADEKARRGLEDDARGREREAMRLEAEAEHAESLAKRARERANLAREKADEARALLE
ncbi:MAG: hypothetical protein ACRELY_21705 [Polyangiaceae bacterium]